MIDICPEIGFSQKRFTGNLPKNCSRTRLNFPGEAEQFPQLINTIYYRYNLIYFWYTGNPSTTRLDFGDSIAIKNILGAYNRKDV